MDFKNEYIKNLQELASQGCTTSIAALASDTSIDFTSQVLAVTKDVKISVIREAIKTIEDKSRADMLLFLDLNLEEQTRIQNKADQRLQSRENYIPILDHLKEQTWYIASAKAPDEITNPREGLCADSKIMHLTNCPLIAATYGTQDGSIISFKINDGFNFRKHTTSSDLTFSPLQFDRESELTTGNFGLLVSGVIDDSCSFPVVDMIPDEQLRKDIYKFATKIGFTTKSLDSAFDSGIDVVAIEPTMEIVDRTIKERKELVANGDKVELMIPKHLGFETLSNNANLKRMVIESGEADKPTLNKHLSKPKF